jgi:hypothetical protein
MVTIDEIATQILTAQADKFQSKQNQARPRFNQSGYKIPTRELMQTYNKQTIKSG